MYMFLTTDGMRKGKIDMNNDFKLNLRYDVRGFTYLHIIYIVYDGEIGCEISHP